MTDWGRYRVVGSREYRGHSTGQEFIARLDTHAAQRAIQRGDIVFVERVTPQLPSLWGLPAGWEHKKGVGL